jgi:uncharacterized membrane protein
MRGAVKYLWAALAVALVSHFVFVQAVPRFLMGVAMKRVGRGEYNAWRLADRVTPASRAVVRPSPDFAYSACAYDLEHGPVTISVAPWNEYWSLSLYAANSDNYFVVGDREVQGAAVITLLRDAPPDLGSADGVIVESPSTRGIALIRRLAPTLEAYNAAAQAARSDVCAPQSRQ